MYAHIIRWAAGQTCGDSGWSGTDWRNTYPMCQSKMESSAFSIVMHNACCQCVDVHHLQQFGQEEYLTLYESLQPMFCLCSLHWSCETKSGTERYEARSTFKYSWQLILLPSFQALRAHGAGTISVFVTHAVFPQESWRRFTELGAEFAHF